MAREGLVALDEPVEALLPEGAAPPVRGRPFTLGDLACHGSGLPRLPKGVPWTGLLRERRDPYASIGAQRLDAAIPQTPPKRAPGERWAYSNYGAGLLGHALARRVGCTLRRARADPRLLAFLRLHAGEPPGPLADAVVDMRRQRLRRGPMSFGLGWVILPGAKGVPFEILMHDGGTGGFRSFAGLSHERHVAVVVLASRVRVVQGIGMRVMKAAADR